MKYKQIVYVELYVRITRAKMSVKEVASKIGIEAHTIYRKMRGETEWKLSEAIAIKKLLGYNGPIEQLFAVDDTEGWK